MALPTAQSLVQHPNSKITLELAQKAADELISAVALSPGDFDNYAAVIQNAPNAAKDIFWQALAIRLRDSIDKAMARVGGQSRASIGFIFSAYNRHSSGWDVFESTVNTAVEGFRGSSRDASRALSSVWNTNAVLHYCGICHRSKGTDSVFWQDPKMIVPFKRGFWFLPTTDLPNLATIISNAGTSSYLLNVMGVCDGCMKACHECGGVPHHGSTALDLETRRHAGLCANCGGCSLLELQPLKPSMRDLRLIKQRFEKLKA